MKKNCPNCNKLMTDVRKALHPDGSRIHWDYPKEITDPGVKKTYHEYRFACPGCGKEWIYVTNFRHFEEITKDAMFLYSRDKGMLIPNKNNPAWKA